MRCARLWVHHCSAWSDIKLLDLSNPDKQMSDVRSLRKDGKGSRTRSANGLAQSPPLWDRKLSCTRYLDWLHLQEYDVYNYWSWVATHRGRSCRKLRKPFWVKGDTVRYYCILLQLNSLMQTSQPVNYGDSVFSRHYSCLLAILCK